MKEARKKPTFKTKAAEIVWQMKELTDEAFRQEQVDLEQLKIELQINAQKLEECKAVANVSYAEINDV